MRKDVTRRGKELLSPSIPKFRKRSVSEEMRRRRSPSLAGARSYARNQTLPRPIRTWECWSRQTGNLDLALPKLEQGKPSSMRNSSKAEPDNPQWVDYIFFSHRYIAKILLSAEPAPGRAGATTKNILRPNKLWRSGVWGPRRRRKT